MIICKIIGGLGNQMFQWAFGRSLAIELNMDMLLDITGYANQHGLTPRRFQLNNFDLLEYKTWSPAEIIHKNQWIKISDEFNYDLTMKTIKSTLGYNLYLDGYWQSEKYFSKYKEIICNDFKMNDREMLKLENIIEPNSVSLHIRRTDYVSLSDYHPVQPASYYKSALEVIGDYNKLYVFSDDINWCKENLNFNKMIFIEGKTNLEDLRLMSLCKHNIIANSSFSWWGAWLNENPSKIIVAPKTWFGSSANINTSDIIPENWIKL